MASAVSQRPPTITPARRFVVRDVFPRVGVQQHEVGAVTGGHRSPFLRLAHELGGSGGRRTQRLVGGMPRSTNNWSSRCIGNPGTAAGFKASVPLILGWHLKSDQSAVGNRAGFELLELLP